MGNRQSIPVDFLTEENLKLWDKIWKELDVNKSNTLDKKEFAVLISRILSTVEDKPSGGSHSEIWIIFFFKKIILIYSDVLNAKEFTIFFIIFHFLLLLTFS